MTQDKSEEYLSTAIQAFPFTIIFILAIGSFAYAHNPQLGERILLSIPFVLAGYGVIVFPILDLAGMHKLSAISIIIYALLAILYATLVAVIIMFYNVQWVMLYTALGLIAAAIAVGFAYILLNRQGKPCELEYG
jgi:4-amino-4-deoxy-L-arabinose transferase-like glycosyltransferase